MLHRELPVTLIEPSPWGRWLAPLLAVAAALLARSSGPKPVASEPTRLSAGPDFSLVGSSLSLSHDPVALTTGEG